MNEVTIGEIGEIGEIVGSSNVYVVGNECTVGIYFPILIDDKIKYVKSKNYKILKDILGMTIDEYSNLKKEKRDIIYKFIEENDGYCNGIANTNILLLKTIDKLNKIEEELKLLKN